MAVGNNTQRRTSRRVKKKHRDGSSRPRQLLSSHVSAMYSNSSSTLYSSTLHDIHAGRNDQFRTARLRGAVSDVTHKENELWMNEWKARGPTAPGSSVINNYM